MNLWAVGVLAWLAAIIIGAPLLGRWLRRSREHAEQQARTLLSMPPGHPEWLTGGEKAAKTGDFASWGAELRKAGVDAGLIINEHRRGQS